LAGSCVRGHWTGLLPLRAADLQWQCVRGAGWCWPHSSVRARSNVGSRSGALPRLYKHHQPTQVTILRWRLALDPIHLLGKWKGGRSKAKRSRGSKALVLLGQASVAHVRRGRPAGQVEEGMGRPPCCEKAGLKKGPWSPEEDLLLVSYVQEHGPGNWRAVPCSTGTTLCSEFVLLLSRLDGWCHGGCFISAIP
jgi:hypothetical protein